MNLKKLLLLSCNVFGLISFAQVGINTTTPNAQLDIRATSATTPSNTDGLLIPKVNVFPAVNPTAAQQGMLLFLTTTSGTNMPGFYYWDNPTLTWIGLGKDVKAWQLSGNTVNAATDFMGSTNDADVIFKRNNVRAGRLGINNTSFGVNALNINAGLYNTAFGVNTLRNITNTGEWNTGIGHEVLNFNTSGSFNTGLGEHSMYNNTTGLRNVAVGSHALEINTTGSENTGVGAHTNVGSILNNATAIGARASVTASNSLVLGSISGTNGATASTNVGIGTTAPLDRLHIVGNIRMVDGNQAAGKVLTSDINGTATWQTPTANNWLLAGNTVNAATDFMGSTNNADVIFKHNNLRAGRIGASSTSFGVKALNPASTGPYNNAIGLTALSVNTTGERNNAMGFEALLDNVTGVGNTALGDGSLYENKSGKNNSAIGYNSLVNNSTGNNNSALGYAAFNAGATYSNSTALGANTVITASNQVRLGNNAVTSIGGQVGWTTLSDARFKTENAKEVPGIDFIKKLRPVTYYVNHEAMNAYLEAPKGKNGTDRTSANGQNTYKPEYVKSLESGFMAQEVEQAAKELGYDFNGVDVPKNDKDYYGLRYSQFVVPLVKAVQELNEKVEQKQTENEQLKVLLLELEKRIAKLEKSDSK